MRHVRTIASERYGNDYYYRCNNEQFEVVTDGPPKSVPCGAQVILIFKDAAVKQ